MAFFGGGGVLGVAQRKLKKGPGLRQGRQGPRIQSGPKLPDINYGAVAQQGRDRPDQGFVPRRFDILPSITHTKPPKRYQQLPRIGPEETDHQHTGALPQIQPLNPAGQRRIKEITREKRLGIGKYKPIQAGVLPIEHMGGPLGIAQTLLTQVGQTAIGVGPGMYHIAGGMIHHPDETTAMMVHQFAHSMGQTIHHPLRQLQEDPLGLITNVLIPLGATAGTAARVAEFSRTAEALRAGEITNAQAVSAIGKTLMRPHPQQRSIRVTPDTPTTHSVHVGYDLGLDQLDLSKMGDALDRAGIKVPQSMKGKKSWQDIQDHNAAVDKALQLTVGKHKLEPQGFETGSQEHIIRTPSEVEAKKVARDVKSVLSKLGIDHGVEVLPAEGGIPGLRISPPAFKGALGGYLQTKVLDPFFEHSIKPGRFSGTKQKLIAVGRELKMPDQVRGAMPEGHLGKLQRWDIERQMRMRRGLEEVKQAKMMGEGTTTMYHGGPRDLEGGVLDAGRAHPSNYFGGGVYATDSPEIAKIYSLTHDEPLVHKLEVYSKSLANGDAPMTKEMLKALEPHIGPVPKGTTLRQVFEDINRQASPGYHDLVKPVTAGGSGIRSDKYLTGAERSKIADILERHRHLDEAGLVDEHLLHVSNEGSEHMVQIMGNEEPLMHGVNHVEHIPAIKALIEKHHGEAGHYDFGEPIQDLIQQHSGLPDELRPQHSTKTSEIYFPSRDDANAFAKEFHDLITQKQGMDIGAHYHEVNPDTEGDIPATLGEWQGIFEKGNFGDRGNEAYAAAVRKDLASLGIRIPSGVLPHTVQQALSGIGIHGMHYKGLTDAGDLKSLATITGKAGADLKSAMGKVGKHRESVIWNPEDALHEGPPQLSAGEAQKRAYAIGAAKTHHDVWRSLYDGGAGYGESFAHDPKGYVAIRKPPDEIKWKGYSSEAGVGRKFQEMVETDPEKIAADPHAFSFIPRGMWQRMKLFTPGTGHLARAADVLDRGTQIIRIGRFLHPGYAAWAVQNGILHATQAGMFAFRNAWQLRHDFSRLTDEEKAVFDNAVGAGHFGGGIARASAGSETSKFAETSKKLAGFWHKVDDRYWRRMSFIHELNHEGYHSAEDWAKLMRENNPKFRRIAHQSENAAINYAEMSPSERATFQKLFTAWGWTRGASTYTMRYPLEHPVQFQGLERIGEQGKKHVENYYAGKNGMVPNWLRGYLPIGHGNRPFMLAGGLLNPGETFGNLLGEVPGATKGQTESLSQEEAPVPASLQEMLTGMTRFGQQLKGNQRFTQPLADLAKRFTPFSDVQSLRQSKKGAGTFEQGPQDALARFFSVPISRLNDAKQAAALGMKDYEQSLARPDEINFRYHMSVQRLDQEAQLFRHRTGNPVSHALMGKVKGDLDAVHTRDMFQYSYAKSHGANSYRSLPAINRLKGAIEFMTAHKYLSTEEASRVLSTASRIKDDTQLASLANELWSDTGIGAVASSWASTMKDLQKPTLTPARP